MSPLIRYREQLWQPDHPESGDIMYLIDDLTDEPTTDPEAGQPKGLYLDWSRGAIMGGYFNTSHHVKDNRRKSFETFMDSYYSIVWGYNQSVLTAVLSEHTITAASTTATDGTFTLTVDGDETTPLAHDANAAAIRTALLLLDAVEDNGVVTIDSGSGLGTNDGVCTLTWWDPNGHTVTADMAGLTGNAHVLANSVVAGPQQDTKASCQIGYQCLNRGWMNAVLGWDNTMIATASIVAGRNNVVGASSAAYRKRIITAYREPGVSPPNGEIDIADDHTAEFPAGAPIGIHGVNPDASDSPELGYTYVASSSFGGGVTTIVLGKETPWDITVSAETYIVNISSKGTVYNSVFGFTNAVYGNYDFVGGANHIVEGDYAFAAGNGNNISGDYASAVGASHTVSGNYATALGNSNSAVGTFSTAIGSQCRTDGTYSVALGERSRAKLSGQLVHAAGWFAAAGDAQASQYVVRVSATHDDAAWKDLTLSGTVAASGNVLAVPEDSVWTFDILVVGSTAGVGKAFSFRIEGAIQNDGGTTAIMASTVTVIDNTDDTDFAAQVVANDTLNCLQVQTQDTTSGGDVVRWVASVKTVEVLFA